MYIYTPTHMYVNNSLIVYVVTTTYTARTHINTHTNILTHTGVLFPGLTNHFVGHGTASLHVKNRNTNIHTNTGVLSSDLRSTT